MTDVFQKRFVARWDDMDFNAHMGNRAYLGIAADVRMLFYAENGLSMRDFEDLKLGPVILSEELAYYREFRLLEPMTVTLQAVGPQWLACQNLLMHPY